MKVNTTSTIYSDSLLLQRGTHLRYPVLPLNSKGLNVSAFTPLNFEGQGYIQLGIFIFKTFLLNLLKMELWKFLIVCHLVISGLKII